MSEYGFIVNNLFAKAVSSRVAWCISSLEPSGYLTALGTSPVSLLLNLICALRQKLLNFSGLQFSHLSKLAVVCTSKNHCENEMREFRESV